jgi:hypothetical protein
LVDSSHLLFLRAKGEDLDNVIFISEFFVIVSHSVGHFDQGTFSFVTDLLYGNGSLLLANYGVSIGVVADGKAENFTGVLGDNFCLKRFMNALFNEDLGDGHKVFG